MKTLICKTCQKPFDVQPCNISRAKFCSPSCYHEDLKKRPSPRKGVLLNSVELACEHCGKPFIRIASRLKWGRGKTCSAACQYAMIKQRTFEKTPKATCLNCQKVFAVPPSRRTGKRGVGKYCSRKCRDAHRIGDNHPQYLNGRAQEHRGANWQAQKRKAKRRDKWTCQHCGTTAAENREKTGQPMPVHHITPYRHFDSYLEANELANLVTLCSPCHRKADAEIQRSEREA